jgi:anaerobic selenocysteine-containing dehydrogenase
MIDSPPAFRTNRLVPPCPFRLGRSAQYRGVEGSLCKHGNVNVLTRDAGTSRLGQGPSAHSCLAEVERFEGEVPEVTAFEPPVVVPA